jgi:hypothetical protein
LTVYERTLPPAPSSGWFGFIVNYKGLDFKCKAKVLTGFIKSQTKLLLELKPVSVSLGH